MEYRAKAQRGTAVSLFLLIYALLLGITATVVPPETSGLILEGIKNSALLEILKENLWEETPQGYLQKTLGFKQKNDEEGKLSQEYALWLLTGAFSWICAGATANIRISVPAIAVNRITAA